jgi:hypothetical protein
MMSIKFSRVRWGWALAAGLTVSVLIGLVVMLLIITAYTISLTLQAQD